MTYQSLQSSRVTRLVTRAAADETSDEALILCGEGLRIPDLVGVARAGRPVRLTEDTQVHHRVQASCEYILQAAQAGEPIYGVTTVFGGMADVVVPVEALRQLQQNMPWAHKTGAGRLLPQADVRAGMLLRANSLVRGASGIRLELIQRLLRFLNAGVTPHVHELGSIGASGDLVPLGYITGCLIGLDSCFRVDFCGEDLDAPAALERLGLEPIQLNPKEGLAIMNGTSVMTGMAANCVADAQHLTALGLAIHALYAQALQASNQSFHPFIHRQKPHPGQLWAAEQMLRLLYQSQLIRDELDGRHNHRHNDLIQDRYSLRCLPQYSGPILEGLQRIAAQIEQEMNSTTDNPLIDPEEQRSYHGGNFLGQYVGVAMDQLRYYIGLQAKHLDAQIALLVAPPFNGGLPASLVGNPERRVNVGLKALQITGNSIMPLLTFYGNTLADRYPTHAEQFNQNINSQGFGSAYLARQSVGLFQQYLAVALIFGVQAVALRCAEQAGHYDALELLSPATRPLYEAVYRVVGRTPSAERPLIWNDDEQALDMYIACLAADLSGEGSILQAIAPLWHELQGWSPDQR
jgi:phenylalanine ammonia-lyase